MMLTKYPTAFISLMKKNRWNLRWVDQLSICSKYSFSSLMEDHIQRTVASFRNNIISDATVIETSTLSPSVIGLKLKVESNQLSFFPGQWVDLFIPNINQVGGFSMHSPPSLLKKTQQLCLAVKKSSWPPALWVHSKCRVGDQVQIRVGGDFYYDPPMQSKIPNLLFIAGGVGINPLLSIMLELKHNLQITKFNPPERISLLYSARNKEELLFQNELQGLKAALPEIFDCKYFVTRSTSNGSSYDRPSTHDPGFSYNNSRITFADLEIEVRSHSDLKNLICFVCGPPPMTEGFISDLIKIGLTPQQIKSEKWW